MSQSLILIGSLREVTSLAEAQRLAAEDRELYAYPAELPRFYGLQLGDATLPIAVVADGSVRDAFLYAGPDGFSRLTVAEPGDVLV